MSSLLTDNKLLFDDILFSELGSLSINAFGDLIVNGEESVGLESGTSGVISLPRSIQKQSQVFSSSSITFPGKLNNIYNPNKYYGKLLVREIIIQEPPLSLTWNSVTWSPELGLFCAVGVNNGTKPVKISSDGINWLTITAVDASWNSVTWSPELGIFCAVNSDGGGNSTYSMTSPDGINWTTQSGGMLIGEWLDVAWSPQLGIFCAVTFNSFNNDKIVTSTDGLSWSSVSGTSSYSLSAITWSPQLGLFCATNRLSGTFEVYISSNGTTWTPRTVPALDVQDDVAWSPELGLFCVVGNTNIITSPDGFNWINRGSSGNCVSWNAGLGLFLTGKSTSTPQNFSSQDGITWTSRTTQSNMTSITSSEEIGIFCGVGGSGVSTSIHSQPIVGFVDRDTGIPNATWNSVVWSPDLGIFCAVASSASLERIVTSPDAIEWTTRTTPATREWQSVTWSPQLGLFCAVASWSQTNGPIMTSPDGITWTSRDVSLTGTLWKSITWSPELGLFCAVGEDSLITTTDKIITSPDGVTWTFRNGISGISYNSVTWSPELGIFCAVGFRASGSGTRISTSPDGITWTPRVSADETITFNDITWSPDVGIFCAVTLIGTSQLSTDGINWSSWELNQGGIANLTSVTWSPYLRIFCAVPRNFTFAYYSYNGKTWVFFDQNVSGGRQSICWSPEYRFFVTVGSQITGTLAQISI